MPVKSALLDLATGETATVDSKQGLHVVNHAAPPNNQGFDEELLVFRQFLTVDGLSGGSSDMVVDGTTPVEFWVPAFQSTSALGPRDRYITTLSFLLSDGTMDLSLFGGLAALSNGCKLSYFTPSLGTTVIEPSVIRNVDFMRLSNGQPSFGTAAAAFLAGSVSAAPGKDDAYLPVIDFRSYGLPHGVRLPANSGAKIVFTIQDDLGELTQFDVVAQGFEHIL
jgi:hypothetical protein